MLVSCSHFPLALSASTDWCAAGFADPTNGPWRSLEAEAVKPVAQDHLSEALRKLRLRSHVRVTARYARKAAESSLEPKRGDVFYLVRAGILGGPDVSLREYIANHRERIQFAGSISRNEDKLMIHTFSTSLAYPSRRMAVVVRTRPTIKATLSHCRSVR